MNIACIAALALAVLVLWNMCGREGYHSRPAKWGGRSYKDILKRRWMIWKLQDKRMRAELEDAYRSRTAQGPYIDALKRKIELHAGEKPGKH